jgi:hypothetical protein
MADIPISIWTTDTDYVENENIVIWNNALYLCIITHTSYTWVTDWGTSKWKRLTIEGLVGPKGDQGDAGPSGANGANGATGPNGAPGVDGIFSAIASKTEAELGTDNVKGMSPLRVAEAIVAQAPTVCGITALQAEIDAAEAVSAALNTRVTNLEATPIYNDLKGVKLIPNAITATTDIGGSPVEFKMSAASCKVFRATIEISRMTDADERRMIYDAVFFYLNSTWQMEDGFKIGPDGEDGLTYMGVDLSIRQDGDVVYGQYEITDALTGTIVTQQNYIRFRIQELESSFA